MSTIKRVSGDYTIQTLGANTVTINSALANTAVDMIVDGNLTVTGSTSIGNVSVTKIFTGNSNVDTSNPGGNVSVGVNGTSNVAVFAPAGAYITGLESVTGNVIGGNINTAGVVSATGNIVGGNINTAGVVSATGNIIATANVAGGNLRTAGQVTATGNVTGGNILSAGNVSVTGNVLAGNIVTSAGTVINDGLTTTGNVTGAFLSATGNVVGGNITTAGNVVTVGIVGTGNISTTGNISAGNINLVGSGNFTGGNIILVGLGNINAGNILANGVVSAAGNIDGNNINSTFAVSTGILNASSNVSAAGNVTGSNLVTGGAVIATGNVNAGAIYVTGNITLANAGNITATSGSYFFGDGGYLSNVQANVTGAQQIAYNDTQMTAANVSGLAGNIFAIINGSGNIQVIANTGVYINGVNSVSGNITTPANISGNYILGNGALLTGLSATYGNSNVTSLLGAFGSNAISTSGNITTGSLSVAGNVLGSLLPAANITYDLGSPTQMWRTLYVSSNTVYIGNTALSTAAGNLTVGNSTVGGISAVGGVFNNYLHAGVPNGSVDGIIRVYEATSAQPSIILYTDNSPGAMYRTGFISATGNITGANLNGTIGTAIQTNITSVGTLGSLTVTGNIVGGNLSGTSIVGTLTTASQPNITTIGQLANLSVAGNISGSNLNAVGLSLSGNVVGAINTTSNITTTANVTGGNLIGVVVGTTITATTLSASGNVTGGNLLTGGQLSTTGNVTGGNIRSAGLISVAGSITAASISVSTGNIDGGNINNNNANGVGNIGSTTTYFNTVFAKATSAQYADLAESYTADADYAPGTVLSFGGTAEVTQSNWDSDRRIAGVVSTNPSYVMNATLKGEHVAVVALQGRVPTMVNGPVRKGDLMVSAGNGRARAEVDPKIGAVIGKALEDFAGESGTIEVVVGRI